MWFKLLNSLPSSLRTLEFKTVHLCLSHTHTGSTSSRCEKWSAWRKTFRSSSPLSLTRSLTSSASCVRSSNCFCSSMRPGSPQLRPTSSAYLRQSPISSLAFSSSVLMPCHDHHTALLPRVCLYPGFVCTPNCAYPMSACTQELHLTYLPFMQI